MDRARVSISHVDELALGFGVRADAPRAGALRDFGAAGPELYLGAARALENDLLQVTVLAALAPRLDYAAGKAGVGR